MRFNNWNLEMDTFPVRQYDNLTRRLEVYGDIPGGWNWVALLSIGDNLNIISLQYGEPGLYVDLTADMIPYAGKYNLQLKATQGEKVRHTNIVSMTVNESMSGDVQWPELPSAFSQAVEQAQEAANTAKEAAIQYPKIIDGYWWVYDANSGKFVNSGIYAGGSSPYIGENGNWYIGDEDTGIAATGQQGWSVSAAALDDDGALVLTIRNPADGSNQTLPPVPIDNSAALQAVTEAITAQGTTQVQRVETAGSTAVGEVSTAKDAALQAVDQAQATAVQAVQTAQGSAETAIGAAQTHAVQAVEAKGTEEQGKLNAIVPPPTPEDAGKALVVNEDGTGLVYGDAPGGGGKNGEWELIGDLTLTEDVSTVELSSPSNTYSELCASITANANENSNGSNSWLVSRQNSIRILASVIGQASKTMYSQIYTNFCGELISGYFVSSNTQFLNADMKSLELAKICIPQPMANNINGIRFVANQTGTFLAGDRFIVYGRIK